MGVMGAGPAVLLNLPGSSDSRAYDINNNSVIVGHMDTTSRFAFRYQNAAGVSLGTLPGGTISEAYAINDSNIIVGMSNNHDDLPHAFLWSGSMIMLQCPVGPSQTANDINNSNQVVGWMGVGPSASFYSEAFLWNLGTVINLGKPSNATNSCANAINNNELICGYFTLPEPLDPTGFKRRAAAWIDGSIVDLGTLPGYLRSQAEDVSDDGYIIGYCSNHQNSNTVPKAFIWQRDVMRPLIDFLNVNQAQHEVWYALGMSANGNIAARIRIVGTGAREALLRPIPPKVGDTNCDWLVNVTDLLNVIQQWGPNAPPAPPFEGSADLNEDGAVSVADLLLVIANWGS